MEEEFDLNNYHDEMITQHDDFTDEDSTIGSWLSLIHFPDDTRVQLTKRGRSFIFQTGKDHSVIDLIGRAKWNQFRSNTEVSIPLSTIKTLLGNNEKDLFLSSFSVIGIGSQKLIIPIKLPIKVPGSPIIKILALLCLTRNVFNTGNFQTDNQNKANALIETFENAFGFELPIGVNKRGNYIRIPLQFIQAIAKFFSGEENPSIHNIIMSLNRFSNDDIITFLNTWFTYYRIYRNIKRTDQLFIFRRKNEISEEIANLLQKCDVELNPGTIQENGNIISAYVVKNTEKNHSILDIRFLETEIEEKPDHLLLIKRILALKDQIKLKDDKIDVLEDLISKLNHELQKEQESKLAASYSRFYFETRTKKLEEKFIELKHIREELEKENIDLRKNLSQSGTLINNSANKNINSYLDVNLLELSEATLNIVKEEIIQSNNYNLSSFNAFIKYVKQSTVNEDPTPLIMQGDEDDELEHINELKPKIDDKIDINSNTIMKSNLTNPSLTQKLIKALTLLMTKKENWILLSLAFEENKLLTEFEIRDLLDLELSESRPLMANLIKSGQIEFGKMKDGESGYYLKENLIKEIRVELGLLLRKKSVPADIKSEWKEIFQIF